MSEKYDSFQPRRATSIDGFLSGASQRPRQPQFRAPKSQVVTSAPSQGRTVGLPDMPKRSVPSPVLTQAQVQPERQTYPLDGHTQQHNVESLSRRQKRKAAKAEKRAARKHDGKKHIVRRTAKLLGVLLLISALFFGFRFYKDIAKLTGNKNPFSLLGVFRPVDLKNDNGRVNILVAGNSADDPGHNGANLTDSIMVMSVNTKGNTALMLSIPRDLWVQIPGDGHSKINAAYPNGGMDTLKTVVQDVTGLNIHYTALVNYAAFRDLVDAVGGITINIQSTDKRGIYDSNIDYTTRYCCALAKYPNGPVTLNGKQALNLARARGDPNPYGITYGFDDGDFTRTDNQRKMLLAIKEKVSGIATLANPLKITGLVDAVSSNVTTDLQLNEMQALYYYSKKIDNTKIDSYNINTLKGKGTTMLSNYASPDGQSALIPAAGVDDYTAIQSQIQKVFTAGPLTKENAAVEVLNATDAVGLAKLASNKLNAQGVNVLGRGDAAVNQPATTIVDNSQGQMPNTLAYLKKTYNATIITSPTLTANYPSADFILILGENAVPKPSSTTTQ
jgi:LCP family protein required for cell wall assembly